MVKYSKRRAYGKRRVARRIYRRKYAKKPTKVIQRYVKKLISKKAENKLVTAGFTAGLYPAAAGGNFISNNIFPLSPHTEATYPAAAQVIVAQGTGDGNRVGNRISTSRVHLKGVIYPNPYNAGTNTLNAPIEAIMWIFRLKPGFADTYAQVNTIMTGSLFKIGNSYSGITNTMTDMTLPINSDVILLKKRRVFKVGNAVQGSAAVGSTNSNLYSNNDFKLNQKFSMDITRYVNKRVAFQDTNNNSTTRTTWCVMTFVNADNSAPLLTNIPASFSYFLEYQYEDM